MSIFLQHIQSIETEINSNQEKISHMLETLTVDSKPHSIEIYQAKVESTDLLTLELLEVKRDHNQYNKLIDDIGKSEEYLIYLKKNRPFAEITIGKYTEKLQVWKAERDFLLSKYK